MQRYCVIYTDYMDYMFQPKSQRTSCLMQKCVTCVRITCV